VKSTRVDSSSYAVQLKKGESKLFRSLNPFRTSRSRWLVAFCLIAPALAASTVVAASSTVASGKRSRELQRLLDRVKERLGLDYPVTIELVAKNHHLISVETVTGPERAFLVKVEERVLELLGADELEAALAHELGHVWVFTHHPYLQTEQLANDVALRVVSRDALLRVYDKVWKAGAEKGDLATFLGPDPSVAGSGGSGKQQE
jgi:uncharacterized protein (DUF2267 family)